jgi:DNA-binding HxlR family transcriptional regulator
MTIKKVENELKDINDKSRRDEILNFLMDNPGCTKEDLVRGVKNIVSKKTVIKILNELEREELVKIEREKPNSREYKLFLRSGNILIILNNQIRDFNEEFKKLVEKIEVAIPELILLPFTNKKNISENFIKILFYEQLPLFILKYLMQCLLLKSIVIWPKIIQKEEIRNKLISLVFTETFQIVSDYSNFYNNKLWKSNNRQENYNPKISEELLQFSNDILYFELFFRYCKRHGITKEFENVVDKLWLINFDVQEYLHPEAIRYNLDYQYGKDDWRKYLKLYKQNIKRIEELENDKKQKISRFF